MSTEEVGDGWPEGVGRIVLDQVDSTNAEAARRASRLDRPTWIFTHHQTSGRGRRGRPWADPTGNFAATLLMFPSEPMHEVALNSFVAAVSLLEALEALAPNDGYALKWPNDLLLNGRKIAGILLESSGNGMRVDWLAIGIGVNLSEVPEPAADARVHPGSIRTETGIDVDPQVLLQQLARQMQIHRRRFEDRGFGPIRQLWLSRAANLGAPVTARTMRDETTGTFEDVDRQGNLILATANGRVSIAAGDVFFQGGAPDASGDRLR